MGHDRHSPAIMAEIRTTFCCRRWPSVAPAEFGATEETKQ